MTDTPPADPQARTDRNGGLFGRLTGHSLLSGGEPYLAVDCYEGRCTTNLAATTHQENGPGPRSVRGWGHGVCSCGALSPHHSSGVARRRWHRAHKARAVLGQPEPSGQPTAVAPESVA